MKNTILTIHICKGIVNHAITALLLPVILYFSTPFYAYMRHSTFLYSYLLYTCPAPLLKGHPIRALIFKLLKGAQESATRNLFRQTVYIAWRGGTETLFLLGSYTP
jgi:hypothetical protein